MTILNVIVAKGDREAHQIEGVIGSGTPKPGTCMQLSSDGEYDLWNGAADGEQDEVLLVVEDSLLGKTVDDAYAVGDKVRMYIPQVGDEVRVLVASGETVAIGTKLICDKGTGKWNATTGSPEMEPFKALESSGGALSADKLILCRRI